MTFCGRDMLNEDSKVNSITSRIDAITDVYGEWRNAVPPCPPSVKIELTGLCDLRCWFCANEKNLRRKGNISWEFYTRIIKEMREAGVGELGLFYLGESMLYNRLIEAVAYAKKECGFPYVFLTTNGRLANPYRLRGCMEAGLDSLKFSLNWADAEQCKETTQVDGFHNTIGHIGAARVIRDEIEARTGHRCGIYASSIMYDGEQKERMDRIVKIIRPFVDEHYWLPLYNQAGLITREGEKFTAGNQGRIGALRRPIPCWALFKEGHITFDGKLSACCFDHDGRFEMGDLNTTPFMEAWQSAPFAALRSKHLEGDIGGTVCEHCVAYA